MSAPPPNPDPKEKIKKTRESTFVKKVYRPISQPVAIFLSRFDLHPNQVTLASIFVSIFSGFCFSRGEWPYSILGGITLQMAIYLDALDGDLARVSGKSSPFGHWWDNMANKQIKFFTLLGVSYGAYKQTGEPLCLFLGSVSIFNLVYSTFIAQLKKDVPGGNQTSIMPETNTTFFPAGIAAYGIITLGGLTNQLWFPLFFFSTFGFIWIKQLLSIYKASQK